MDSVAGSSGCSCGGAENDHSDHSSLEKGTYQKFSRKNTKKEKQEMNKLRRKRKNRKKELKTTIQQLKKKVSCETELRKQAERSITTQKQISRTYWERWRWELQKRRETMEELKTRSRYTLNKTSDSVLMHEIDPSMLTDPLVGGKYEETYLARGCFGIVRLQKYRGIDVAVKEFLPRSLITDVKTEAAIISSLSHPYVPFLFGICTKDLPLRMVMQFHTVCGKDVSTIDRVLRRGHFLGALWIVLCAQLMEVIRYLHEEVGILHNDIKGDNVLLTHHVQPEDSQFHIILIDFGKATKVTESKRYNLTACERSEYVRKYPHIPPEVIEGETKQSKESDIYAMGRLLYQISDSGCIDALANGQKMKWNAFAGRCRCTNFSRRPRSKECILFFEQLAKSV